MALKRRKILKQMIDLGYGTQTVPADSGGTLTGDLVGIHTFFGPVYLYASDQAGADMAAQIQAAHDALPSTGGTIDARGFQSTQTGTSTITLSKPVRLLLGCVSLTSSASPVINITAKGVIIEGSNTPSTFSTEHTTRIVTSHATGDIIKTDSKSTTVRNVSLAASGAKSGGAGLHVASGASVVVHHVTIEPCYNGVQMDAATNGQFYGLMIGADSNTPTAANWNSLIYLLGDENGAGVITDTSFYHPVLSIDRKPANDAIFIDHGTDSIQFWNLEAVTTSGLTNCRSADCGSILKITNSDPTNVDPPRTIRFFGGVMESSTANIGINIESCKDCIFHGTNIDLALIGLQIDEVTTLSRNPGNVQFINGRILATVRQGVLINGSNGVVIRGNRIGDTSYVASSYPAVEVAADVTKFHIDDNNFEPEYGFIDAPITYPTYFVKVGVGGGDEFTISRNTMPSTLRTAGNISDGSTGLNKIVGPNNSDVSPFNAMSIYGQYISTLSIGTAPIVVTSTTPATNLHANAIAYNQAGTQLVGYHLSQTTDALSGGTKTVTWTGSSVFSNTSYSCQATNKGGTGDVRYDIVSASQVTVTGTGTETFTLWCFGA